MSTPPGSPPPDERLSPTLPRIAVGGIAFDRTGRVLLIRRARPPGQGLWSIPGGRVELGETLTEACVRELREETGLTVSVDAVAEVLDRIGRATDGAVTYHYVIIDYLVTVTGGHLRPGGDVSDAAWFDLDELSRLPTTDGLLPVLIRARDQRVAMASR
ncbi:MAG: NUDIX hydrolase [Myxococcota bacterium]